MAGKQSGKDKKNDVGVEDEEVNDTNVKTLSLDFECGQRVLSQVHILCQVTLFVYVLSLSLCECVRANCVCASCCILFCSYFLILGLTHVRRYSGTRQARQ